MPPQKNKPAATKAAGAKAAGGAGAAGKKTSGVKREASASSSDSSSSGADDLPDYLTCGICLDLVTGATQTPCCGGLSCKACIEAVAATTVLCPYCREAMARNPGEVQVHPDVRVERLAAHFVRACKHAGCDFKAQRDELVAHEPTCCHRPAHEVIAELRDENEALRNVNEALGNGEEALRAENEALRAENEVLRNGDEALRNVNEAFRAENEALRNGDEALRNVNEALGNVNEALRAENEALRAEIEALAEAGNQWRRDRCLENSRIRSQVVEANGWTDETETHLELMSCRVHAFNNLEGPQAPPRVHLSVVHPPHMKFMPRTRAELHYSAVGLAPFIKLSHIEDQEQPTTCYFIMSCTPRSAQQVTIPAKASEAVCVLLTKEDAARRTVEVYLAKTLGDFGLGPDRNYADPGVAQKY